MRLSILRHHHEEAHRANRTVSPSSHSRLHYSIFSIQIPAANSRGETCADGVKDAVAARQKDDLKSATYTRDRAAAHLHRGSAERLLALTSIGRLQPAQPFADGLLRVLVALPLIFNFQPGPLIGIDGFQLGPAEHAIRSRLQIG